MSNTISAEEYRRMNSKKSSNSSKEPSGKTGKLTVSAIKAFAKYNQHDVPETTTGKLDTVAALKAMGNYFELDAKSVNFLISQWKISGKI